jgi:hypothetical protein
MRLPRLLRVLSVARRPAHLETTLAVRSAKEGFSDRLPEEAAAARANRHAPYDHLNFPTCGQNVTALTKLLHVDLLYHN